VVRFSGKSASVKSGTICLSQSDPLEERFFMSSNGTNKYEVREVIIVGSGPAGLTAAIYAARGNLNPLVIEGYGPGGQLMLTSEVENYPGFENGIMGPELMMQFRAQAKRFGAEFITKDATKVELTGEIKKVWVDADLYLAKSVIISTGASANLLGLVNESRLMGRGVSTCATCDGFFFRDKTIAVIGGGDSAMEEATFLTRFAAKVYIIHRRQGFRASAIMLEKAKNNPKIEFMLDTAVADVLGDEMVTGVTLQNTITGALSELPLDGLFVAIGHTPNTKLFADQVRMDGKGYLITSSDKSQVSATNLSGVFACGDVQDSRYRQAITAAGSGCAAALDAEHYLESLVVPAEAVIV
jgi:thioredoxin reductase (NADPH)